MIIMQRWLFRKISLKYRLHKELTFFVWLQRDKYDHRYKQWYRASMTNLVFIYPELTNIYSEWMFILMSVYIHKHKQIILNYAVV